MTIMKGTPTYRRASLALFAAGFVTFSNLYTTQPLMPIFSDTFHISPSLASLTLSVSTAILAVVMLLAATLSDAIGRKRLMTIAMFSTSILALITALSPNFLTLLIFRALLGVVLAGVPSIAMAFISDEFHKKSLGKVMGLYIAGNSIGGMFGRLATGVFTDLWNWHVALMVIGVISFFLSFYFKFALPTTDIPKPASKKTETGVHRFTEHLKNPALVSLFLVAFLIMGGFVTLFNYIGYRLSGPPYNLSQTLIGAIFIVYLTGTLSSAWMGSLADRKGQGPVALLSLAIMIIGGLGTLTSNLILLILSIAVFTFGFFGIHSVASRWIGDWATTNKAQASSLYLLLYYGGSSIVGVVGGYFWSHFNWLGVILLVTLLLILAFFLVLFVSQRQARLQNLKST
jgi:MFS transporter, YNFM family, putative membrane transport protein